MTETWRFVDAGRQDPFEAMGRMPILSRHVRATGQSVAMTSVWGKTHVNVGWFDDVDATLDLEECRARGIEVVRRPIFGGGTAFYQEGCAAMHSFLLDKEAHPDLDGELARFQPIFLDALERIGLGAVAFEGSSDLRWNDRKLGALTAQDAVVTNAIGSFINLKRPDVDVYLAVARIPDDKFKDKVVKDLREYVVAADEIAGHEVTYEQFRDAIAAAMRANGFTVLDAPMTDDELASVRGIASSIATDDMIKRISSERFTAAAPPGSRVGFGNEKGKKLCRAGVALDTDGKVVAALMAGDMHVGPPDTMDRVAAALVGASASDSADLRTRIASVFEGADVHQPDQLMGVTTDDLLAAVRKAVAAALQ